MAGPCLTAERLNAELLCPAEASKADPQLFHSHMTGTRNNNIILPAELAQAVRVIQAGGIVAFPTETYYGLAADPFNEEALARLFTIKRRPASKPVLVLIQDRCQLDRLVKTRPPLFEPLMDAFWPGPLTLVFEALDQVPSLLTGNTNTVGVRVSSHDVARRLVDLAGNPITATSANISGSPPAVTAADVARQLGDTVDMIVDGGKTRGGHGSTIVGYRNNKLVLIREGVVPFREILAAGGNR